MTQIDEAKLKLLDRISEIEAAGDFNNMANGKDSGVDITSMSLSELYYYQTRVRGRNQRAAGAYQIIPSTLKESWKALGLDPDKTIFSEDTQKVMCSYLLDRRGYKEWVEGNSGGTTNFMVNIAKEWAAIPVPHDMQGHAGYIKKGQSYYAGVGGNKTSVDADGFYEFLNEEVLALENPALAEIQPTLGNGSEPNFANISTQSRASGPGAAGRSIDAYTGAYSIAGEPKNIHFYDIEYRQKKQSILASLDLFSHTIKIHGDFSIRAGSLINIDVRSSPENETTPDRENMISGTYLVTSVQHKFDAEGMYTHLRIQSDRSNLNLESTPNRKPRSRGYINDPVARGSGSASAGGSPTRNMIDSTGTNINPSENFNMPSSVNFNDLKPAENGAFVSPNVRYVNNISSKTRNKQLAPEFVDILQRAAKAAGVVLVVTSAGQDIKGRGTRRTGSIRHDAGYAADFYMVNESRKLNYIRDLDKFIAFRDAFYQAGGASYCIYAAYMGTEIAHADVAFLQGPHKGNGTTAYKWWNASDSAKIPDWVKEADGGPRVRRA